MMTDGYRGGQRAAALAALLTGLVMLGGCALRLAPGEAQRQNAYLHHRTVQAAALQARVDEASGLVQQLTDRATRQSEAIMAYFGMPDEPPASATTADLLGPAGESITAQAHRDGLTRPDAWAVTDQLLELGMALAGVVGGVYGAKLLAALRTAKDKTTALQEIVTGNELFKRRHPEQAASFKQAHDQQSPATRSLVTTLKTGA